MSVQPSLSLLQEATRFAIQVILGSTLMMQVTARDDSGQVCPNATRQLPSGMLAPNGPPTTLSPKGVDRLGFLQGNLTRDATYFVNGSPVGARDIFVVRALLMSHMHTDAADAGTKYSRCSGCPSQSVCHLG